MKILLDKSGEEIQEELTFLKFHAKRASKAFKEGQYKPTLIFVYYSGHGRYENGQTIICDGHNERDVNIEEYFLYFKNTAHVVAIGVMDCCREKCESTKSMKKPSSKPSNKLDG